MPKNTHVVDYNEVASAMRRYGLSLTPVQIQEVFESSLSAREVASEFGFDTGAREVFLDALVAYVGVSGEWPTFSTPDDEAARFYESFAECCRKRGVSYDPKSRG